LFPLRWIEAEIRWFRPHGLWKAAVCPSPAGTPGPGSAYRFRHFGS